MTPGGTHRQADSRNQQSIDNVAVWIYTRERISAECDMRGAKRGNSLASRPQASLVETLELKEGDEVEVHVVGERAFDIARDRSRERVLARIRTFRKALPADWKFDREEANAR